MINYIVCLAVFGGLGPLAHYIIEQCGVRRFIRSTAIS